MKVYKVRMLSSMNAGIKGLEFQVLSNNSFRPTALEVKNKIDEMGIKTNQGSKIITPASNDFEVIN